MTAATAILTVTQEIMAGLGLNYEYDQFSGTPAHPYFVGGYRELSNSPESGTTTGMMTLTGWDQADGIGRLMDASERARMAFNPAIRTVGGLTVMMNVGNVYELPADAAGVKRRIIQIETATYGKEAI